MSMCMCAAHRKKATFPVYMKSRVYNLCCQNANFLSRKCHVSSSHLLMPVGITSLGLMTLRDLYYGHARNRQPASLPPIIAFAKYIRNLYY